MSDRARGMWRVTFSLGEAPALEVLEALEGMAASASIFEESADAEQRSTGWRVELLLEEEPERASFGRTIKRLLRTQRQQAQGLSVDFVPHEEWLAKASMPREIMRIGRLVVHGAGQEDAVGPGDVGILVDAGMAFGSGEHGSTAGCLTALDQLLRRHHPKRVLDLGCGSAILGIAVARCGRAKVLASDNDPVAVEVARANAERNGVAHRLHVVLADGYRHPAIRRAAPFDLVLANILADPLIAMAGDLARHLAPGGHVILAGLLDTQAPAVIEAHRRHGLRVARRVDLGPWTTLILRRPLAARPRAVRLCSAA